MGRDLRKIKEEAARALEKGKWRRAAELFDELVAAQPEDAGSLQRAGELHRKIGAPKEAASRLARAATLYAKQGFLLKAIALCKVILELDPAHTETQSQLAQLYAEHRTLTTPPGKGLPVAAPALTKGERRTPSPGRPLDALRLSALLPAARPLSAKMVELSVEPPPPAQPTPTPAATAPSISSVSDPASLPRTPLFSALGPDALRWLIENVRLVHVEAKEKVFSQGDAGDALYVVARGQVAVLHAAPPNGAPVEVARLSEGAFFGEIALLTDHPRAATVCALEPTDLIAITRELISDLIERSPAALTVLVRFVRDRLCDTLVATSPLFAPFSAADREALVARFRFLEAETDEVLVTSGERSSGLFLLAAGQCAVHAQGGVIAQLGPGEIFGELSLLRRAPAIATIRTASKCYLLHLPREVFAELMVTHPQVLEYVGEVAQSRRPLGLL